MGFGASYSDDFAIKISAAPISLILIISFPSLRLLLLQSKSSIRALFAEEIIMKAKVLGIIPARYQSSRFPAKMLAVIAGKTLLQHTFENASQFDGLDDLVVATDHQRIFDHVKSFGGKVVMTSPSCPTGTDRLAEVMKLHPDYQQYQVVVNIQGDDPCLPKDIVEAVIEKLLSNPGVAMSTAVCPLTNAEQAKDSSVVKCVIDRHGHALYFSRALIPASHNLDFNAKTTYYKHLGIYAYRTDFLLHYSELPATPLQLAEDLEQLKIMENGYRINVAIVQEQDIPGVNTPEDIAKVEPLLCQRNSYSSQVESVRP